MRLLVSCLVAGVLLTSAVPAQVTQLPNTGCPNTGYPTHSGSARIGQPFTFGYHSCSLPTRQTLIAILGVPSTTGGLSFDPSLTCLPGPCVLYPMPVGGRYPILTPLPGAGNWTVNVPHDPLLVGATLALQCACYCP